jgi:hypothetical protein
MPYVPVLAASRRRSFALLRTALVSSCTSFPLSHGMFAAVEVETHFGVLASLDDEI